MLPNAVKLLPAIPTLPQIELLSSVVLLPSTCKAPTTRLNEILVLAGYVLQVTLHLEDRWARPYRGGIDPQAVLDEIRSCSGTQFDPEMVAALMRVMEGGWLLRNVPEEKEVLTDA